MASKYKRPITSAWPLLRDKIPVGRDDFEKIVLSGLNGEDVVSYDRYFLNTAGKEILEKSKVNFLKEWAKIFKIPYGKQPNIGETTIRSDFQLDCCVRFGQPTALSQVFADIVRGDQHSVFVLNQAQPGWSDINIDQNDHIAFEFSEKVEYIPTKLFQIERMLQLRETCIYGLPVPKAVGIVINGLRSDFIESVRSIDKARWDSRVDTPKIFSIPVFIVHAPYRNVYTEISDLKKEFSDMKKELSDLKEAFRWSLMSRAELRALSAARGLRFSAWTPRSRVILALMDHAAGRPADRPGASAAGSGEHERALCCESARYLQTCNLAPRPFRYGNLSPSEAVPWAQAMADQRLSPARAVRRRRGRPPRSGFAGPSLHGFGPALA